MKTVIKIAWPQYDITEWRTWLVENVGYQGSDWQWQLISLSNGCEGVRLSFDDPHSASLFLLLWGS
jgi:hypothetical protein